MRGSCFLICRTSVRTVSDRFLRAVSRSFLFSFSMARRTYRFGASVVLCRSFHENDMREEYASQCA